MRGSDQEPLEKSPVVSITSTTDVIETQDMAFEM